MHSIHRGKRRFAAIAAMGATAIALSACSAATPSETAEETPTSGVINLLSYSGIWEEEYRAAVIDPFIAEYPDITVNYVAKRSSAEMLSALQAEKTRPSTDIAIMDVSVADSGNEQGLFAKFSESDVPNVANVADAFRNDDGYGPLVMLDSVAMLYDTDTFTTAPTSWDTLWDDEYAGRVNVVAAPSGLGINLTAITADMEGEDFTEGIEGATARLKELAPNVQSWAPNPDEYQSVITGQTVLGVGQNARGQYYADQSDGKLGVAIPTEGTVYQMNAINLLAEAPNSAAAKTFIDYALSPEAQAAFAGALFYAPSITNVELAPEVVDRIVHTDGSINIIPVDQKWLATVREEWTDIWKREIIGG
jgi:putative spermidine/putrescine transport system substrate-binding protein